MQRILVVCGAGASSTFLVHWMRRAIAERGLAAVVAATSTEELAARLGDTDIVLVGSHLSPDFAALARAASRRGVRAEQLPPISYDSSGALTALALALGPSGLDRDKTLRESETTSG